MVPYLPCVIKKRTKLSGNIHGTTSSQKYCEYNNNKKERMLKLSEKIFILSKGSLQSNLSVYDGKKVHLDTLPFFHNKKCSKHNKNSTSKHSQYFISLIPKQGKTILTHYHLCFVNLLSLHVHFCDFFSKRIHHCKQHTTNHACTV